MTKLKIYITDSEFPDNHLEEEIIEKAGGELIGLQCKTAEEIIDKCHDAFGLINQYAPVDSKVLTSLPNLKVVSRMGIGVNTIDVDAASKQKIYVANVPDGSVDEVSNHAFALLMCCMRKLVTLNRAIRRGEWGIGSAIPVHRASAVKLGLMSFGRIPQRLSAKVKGLGVQILVYDPYIPEHIIRENGARPASFEELLKESDYISIHTPLTPDTHHLFSVDEFKMMKKTAYIINTSRGPIIDENALVEALKNKDIAGAALDVYESEPILPDSPLLQLDNVIATPHTAWYSEEALVEIRQKTALNIVDVMEGKEPRYFVNKKAFQ
jgi:D-3-phosphoglycerate dehydrogenase